jgi:8-oxo-dGTP diphosphatase
MAGQGYKREATFVVLKHKDAFLLLKRAKDPHKDKFVPVGGKIEAYESPEDAAIRETFEETGIQLHTIQYCGTLTETSPTEYNWVSFVYAADIDKITPPSCNEGELRWIGFDDIYNVPTPTTDRIIFRKIRSNQKFALNAIYDAELNLQVLKDELSGEFFEK